LTRCFFSSDLHGYTDRYLKLFNAISLERPDALFLGGDLLPSGGFRQHSSDSTQRDFIGEFFIKELKRLHSKLKADFPRLFLILGNDDARSAEEAILKVEDQGLWEYVHNQKAIFQDWVVFGYSYIPPSPFLLKDWEKYDVSRYVDPGGVSPEEGMRSVPESEQNTRYSTIKKDLEELTGNDDLRNAIFLFHAPPYKTKLDRAELDGKKVNHVPLDVNVGSIAVQRFIKNRQPLLTLHGHIHESARLSGSWKDRIGQTFLFSAAHDGPELALVRFNPKEPERATRELI
jgi:Icc-related predicted phosphoesterase